MPPLEANERAVYMSAQTPQTMENNRPRRSSRRIRGLAPSIDPPPPPPKAVYLPPELKVAVLGLLFKSDLKTVRLVSKEWSALATGPLFDRVYISCRAKDMEVFRNVTRHKAISMGVRELVYDGSIFKKEIDLRDYFEKLYLQVRFAWQLKPATHFDSADAQINRFVQDCNDTTISISKLYKTHKRDTFLVEGFRKYRDCSEFEHRYVERLLLNEFLCAGLYSLKHLRSVVLSTTIWWHHFKERENYGTTGSDTSYGPSSGSPLSRSWNPFHLRPTEILSDLDDERSHMCAQFHILTRALSATNKNVTSLQNSTHRYAGGLPQQALMRSNLTDSESWHFMTAYSSLRCLEIDITMNNPDQRDTLTLLPELLRQTFGLRRLCLHISKEYGIPASISEYYRYDKIFPALGFWPELTELGISGIAISGWYLMSLLWRARLTRLNLSAINLLDGTWEGIIVGMRYRGRLTELNMFGNFKHCGGAVFRPSRPEGECTDRDVLHDIESYVEYGGGHPCLTPESDPHTVERWFLNMMPDKEFDDFKLSARENGLNIDDLIRIRD